MISKILVAEAVQATISAPRKRETDRNLFSRGKNAHDVNNRSNEFLSQEYLANRYGELVTVETSICVCPSPI